MKHLSLFAASLMLCAAMVVRAQDKPVLNSAAAGGADSGVAAPQSAPKAEAAPVESAPKAEAAPVESAPKAEAAPVESAPKAEAAPAASVNLPARPEAVPLKVEQPEKGIVNKIKEKKEPAAEPLGREEAAPQVAAPAPNAAEKPKLFTSAERLEVEWNYLKDAAQDATEGVSAAALDDLSVFIQQHPDAPMMDEAQALLASLYARGGDSKSAMVALLRLLYEHPDSKTALRAKSDLLGLGDKNLSRKLRPALGELVKVPDSPDKAERLSVMMQRVVDSLGEALHDPIVQEIRRFQVRFPDYPKSDMVQWSLAQMQEKDSRFPAALLAYRKLIAAFPESAYRAKAQLAVGGVYADDLRDYTKAIEAYQELAAKYPESPEVLPALARMAQLFSGKLKQYELAVEMDEKIIKLFPKTDGALKAFNDEAALLRDRLAKPEEAIKAYRRLTEQFGPPAAVEALQSAAVIAGDLKDFRLDAELRVKVAADYSGEKAAPGELYSAAEIYETSLNDLGKAIDTYKEVASKFPHTKQGRWAQARIAKLEKK